MNDGKDGLGTFDGSVSEQDSWHNGGGSSDLYDSFDRGGSYDH